MAALNRNGVRIPLIGGICLLPDRNALDDLAVQTDHEIAADGNSVTAALIFQSLKIIMVLLCRRPRICHIVNHDPVDDRDIRPRSGISVDREKLLINPVWHLDRGRIDQLADHFPAQRPACSRTQEENKQTQKQPHHHTALLLLPRPLPADCRLPAGCTPLPATRSAPRLILFPQTQTVFSSVLHIYHSP